MIKIYGMPSCPDCSYVHDQIVGREDEFDYIDIGSHVKKMKEFTRLRDTNPVFDTCKASGGIGIPAFVFEDGTVSLDPEDAGLKANPGVSACSIEDHKAGRKGC
ncbi:MAG: glutaredoxin [Bulleidia sp.]|nr:glutaredoxin [Bulleidia sp.]